MRNLRSTVTALAVGLAGMLIGQCPVLAQEDPTPISVTLEPVQYAAVKGNVDKFRALNWMKDGYQGGATKVSFIKQINKDTSVEFEGSTIPKANDDNGHLILRKGDLGFLKLNYKSFRKYYDNTGGVYQDNGFPGSLSGTKAGNSPDLQMDMSYFKLEAGLGEINNPFLDVAYEHDTKDGAKSMLKWTGVVGGAVTKLIGPSWRQTNDTVDTVTVKENKKIAGVTFKGEQRAEVDYNHNYDYFQFLSNTATPANNKIRTQEESPDAKLFSSGVRAEKWMFNDKTFAGLGYHYNHVHATELMRNQEFSSTGVLYNYGYAHQSFWSFADNIEDEHVLNGDLHTSLTPDLDFISDVKYAYSGRNGIENYLDDSTAGTPPATPSNIETGSVKSQDNLVGEHVALRYYGISHTSLYAEADMQQDRNWFNQNLVDSVTVANDFSQEVIRRTQKESWTLGGRVVPNKYFIITTQVRQHWEDNRYDFISGSNPDLFLDALKINGEEASSTVEWKPYHWLSNSVRYQFLDNRYFPKDVSTGSGTVFDATENHMLSSVYTYDITLQPIDPLSLVLSYSHAENYVKTLAGSSTSVQIPGFNSGDNSWLFSSTYYPKENLSWNNTVMYTIADNYVDFSAGLPLGSNFRQLTFSTGIDWTVHKWITIEPGYEYASYRDNSLTGLGNYSANIFKMNVKFNW